MEMKLHSDEQLLLRITIVYDLYKKHNLIRSFAIENGTSKWMYSDYSGFIIKYNKNFLFEGEKLSYKYRFTDV